MIKSLVASGAMLIFAFSDPAFAASAQSRPNGTLEVSFSGAAAGIGATIGKGTLTYKGYKIPFDAASFEVGQLGVGVRKAKGFVYNLHDLRDFNSTYSASTGSLALIAGRGYEHLENDKGVVIELKSEETGIALGLTAGKTKITLHDDDLTPVLKELNAPPKRTAGNSVYFQSGSAEVSDSEKSKLHEIIDVVRKNPATEVRITGFTDTEGSLETNVALSTERAKNVHHELERIAKQSGLSQLPPERIDVFGFGETGTTEDKAVQADRRVDIAIYSSPRSRKDVP